MLWERMCGERSVTSGNRSWMEMRQWNPMNLEKRMPAHIVRILLCAASTGYEFHRLSSIEEDALWKKIMKGEEENGSEMD